MADKSQLLLASPIYGNGTFVWGETTAPIQHALLKQKTGSNPSLTTCTDVNSSAVLGSYDERRTTIGLGTATSQLNRSLSVIEGGHTPLRASGAITYGSEFQSAGDASGSICAVSGTANVLGRVLQTAAHGDVVMCHFYGTARVTG